MMVYPVAELFPMLSAAELNELAMSIQIAAILAKKNEGVTP